MKSVLLTQLQKFLFYSGICSLFLQLERRFGWKRSVVCLCYHTINQSRPAKSISDLEGGTTVSTLDAQVGGLSQWLAPICDHDLADWLDDQTTLDRDALLVTFDDGYRDNRTLAGPVLRRHNVSGLIFIATDYVNTDNVFWWTRLSDAMRLIKRDEWKALSQHSLPEEIQRIVSEENLETFSDRKRARRRVAMLIGESNYLDEVVTAIESAVDESYSPTLPILSWEEIVEMQNDGFHFGGHTHSHPLLSHLSVDEIRNELTTSQEILEGHLGGTVCSIAYPAGNYDQRVVDVASSSSFRIGFTTKPGIILKSSQRFELPRIYLDRTKPHELGCSLVALCIAKYLPERFSKAVIKLGVTG